MGVRYSDNCCIRYQSIFAWCSRHSSRQSWYLNKQVENGCAQYLNVYCSPLSSNGNAGYARYSTGFYNSLLPCLDKKYPSFLWHKLSHKKDPNLNLHPKILMAEWHKLSHKKDPNLNLHPKILLAETFLLDWTPPLIVTHLQTFFCKLNLYCPSFLNNFLNNKLVK